MPKQKTLYHQSILEAVRNSDEEVLWKLYKENYAAVESYILKNNGTSEQADDIYQEAFLILWRNVQLNKFVPQNEQSFQGYLCRIARNKWVDYLRSGHYKKNQQFSESFNSIADEEIVDNPEEKWFSQIEINFSKLNKECQQILIDFYYENKSMAEISEERGWTPATARNNKYRCLQKLRELIKKQ